MKKPRAADPRSSLLEELRQTLEQIDEQGLRFLLRQAQVLIHNARVEQMQQKAASSAVNTGAKERDNQGGETGKARRRAGASEAAIEESENGKVFFLVIGKVRKVMDGEEVRRLVRICGGSGSKSEARERLFRVLKQERRDILVDAGIQSASSPILDAVFKAVRDWKGTV